jgi:hypothetical protein
MGDGSSGRPDTKGKGRATPNDGMLALDLENAEGGIGVPNGGGNAFQQMELVEQQVCPMPCSWYRDGSLTSPAMTNAGQLHSIALHRHRVY